MGNAEKYRQYASKIKLFNGLTGEEVSDILHQGQVLEFPQNRTIFHEGQMGNNLFIVLSGTVAIKIRQDLIAKCHPGDAFGEMSVLNHRPHSGTAVAETLVKCFVLDEEHLNSLLEKRVAVRLLLNIIHVLSGYLEKANHKVFEFRRQLKEGAAVAIDANAGDTPGKKTSGIRRKKS
ncbi:MAG: cyclic nucleotide-binding domain-containing protein [Candidatus Hydrogenedentota bacterium]